MPDAVSPPPAADPWGRWFGRHLPRGFTLLGHSPAGPPGSNSTFSACWRCACGAWLNVNGDGMYSGSAVEQRCTLADPKVSGPPADDQAARADLDEAERSVRIGSRQIYPQVSPEDLRRVLVEYDRRGTELARLGGVCADMNRIRNENAALRDDLSREREAGEMSHAAVDRLAARVVDVRALIETQVAAGAIRAVYGRALLSKLDSPAEFPADDPFGTTCAECGEPITDERPSVGEAEDGSGPMHAGCGEPCVCGTRFTCLAHDHEELAGPAEAAEPACDRCAHRVVPGCPDCDPGAAAEAGAPEPGYPRIADAITAACEAADIDLTVVHDGRVLDYVPGVVWLATVLDKAGLIDWAAFQDEAGSATATPADPIGPGPHDDLYEAAGKLAQHLDLPVEYLAHAVVDMVLRMQAEPTEPALIGTWADPEFVHHQDHKHPVDGCGYCPSEED